MAATAVSRTGNPAWPVPPNPILGRDVELGLLYELLTEDEARLVTIVGPGGVGKTRLVIAVVEKLSRSGADNIFFVQLESARDADAMLEAIGAEIGVSEQGKLSLFETTVVLLRDSSPLLILDNLEQIADSAAPLISQLLLACPALSILATSRIPLNLRAERQFQLEPLSPPAKDDADPRSNPALALFESRARAARADFRLTEQNLADTADICRRLDGLPLAIELAAARSRLLSPAAILARLTNRLHVLDNGSRDLPARQRTMQDAILWSYDLLTLVDQVAFRRLAIFPATFSLQAANDLLNAAQASAQTADAGESIAALVDQSLLVVAPSPEDEPRLRMLQPIRDVAWALLDQSGDTNRLSGAHARLFTQVASNIKRGLAKPTPADAIARCERELPNLLAAIDWFASAGEADGALTISGGIARFWRLRGRYSEAATYLKKSLAVSGGVAELRAAALNSYGAVLTSVGDHDAALVALEEAIALCVETGDQPELAAALNNRSVIFRIQGQYSKAIEGFKNAQTIYEATKDNWRAAMVLDNIGAIQRDTGDVAGGAETIARALSTRRALGDDQGIANSLLSLAVALNEQGNLAQARTLLNEARAIRERIGDRPGLAHTVNSLGFVAYKSGDFEEAEICWREALAIQQEIGYPQGIALALHNLGSVALDQGDSVRALSLFRESFAIRQIMGSARDFVFSLQAFARIALGSKQAALAITLAGAATARADSIGMPPPDLNEEIQAMRAELGERQFARKWEDGRVLPVQQAIGMTEFVSAIPVEQLTEQKPSAAALSTSVETPPDHGLTPRELDVLRLVAVGKTNADIGEVLFISPFTAKTHVANLLGKLGVESRAAASTWAAQHRLL